MRELEQTAICIITTTAQLFFDIKVFVVARHFVDMTRKCYIISHSFVFDRFDVLRIEIAAFVCR